MPEYKGIFLACAVLVWHQSSIADTTELNWTGCNSSKAAYVGDLADAYSRKSGILIKLHAGTSNSAIREVHDGAVDIGGTSRYLLSDDPRESGVELVPIAWDALAMRVT